MYYVISVYAGNYRTNARNNGHDRPKAFARGIFGSRKSARAYASALTDHYNDANVIFEALECNAAERRYTLSV